MVVKRSRKVPEAEATFASTSSASEIVEVPAPSPVKRVSTLTGPVPPSSLSQIHGMLKGLIKQDSEARGSRAFRIDPLDSPWGEGLALPSLSTEYLVGVTVWPFSRLVQLYGEKMSLKSTFLYELFRWHVLNGGTGTLNETELKLANEIWLNYVWTPGEEHPRCGFAYCPTVDAWQAKLTEQINHFRSTFVEWEKAKKKPLPVIFGLDSVAAVLTEANRQKILKTGVAGPGHPQEAGANSRWLKALIPELADWPFTLAFVNHMTETTSQQGHVTRDTKGGKQIGYRATLEFRLKRVGRSKTSKSELRTVSIICEKNSGAPDGRQITVGARYTRERHPDTGKLVDVCRWEWHTATMNLLKSLDPTLKKKVAEVVNIEQRVGARSQELFYSSTLGVSRESAMPAEEFGDILMANGPIVTQLRELLMIREAKAYQFEDQPEVSSDRPKKKKAARATAVPGSPEGET